jgi:hypothetical protein
LQVNLASFYINLKLFLLCYTVCYKPLLNRSKVNLKRGIATDLKPKKPRKRLNSENPLILTDYLKQALVGLALGDLHIAKQTPNSNVRLAFEQGMIHSAYLLFLFDLFKEYVIIPPKSPNRKPDARTGKTYDSLAFKTRMLPCFNYL